MPPIHQSTCAWVLTANPVTSEPILLLETLWFAEHLLVVGGPTAFRADMCWVADIQLERREVGL